MVFFLCQSLKFSCSKSYVLILSIESFQFKLNWKQFNDKKINKILNANRTKQSESKMNWCRSSFNQLFDYTSFLKPVCPQFFFISKSEITKLQAFWKTENFRKIYNKYEWMNEWMAMVYSTVYKAYLVLSTKQWQCFARWTISMLNRFRNEKMFFVLKISIILFIIRSYSVKAMLSLNIFNDSHSNKTLRTLRNVLVCKCKKIDINTTPQTFYKTWFHFI